MKKKLLLLIPLVIVALLTVFSLKKDSQFGYTVATDYQKTLSAPMTSSQSFVPVTSLTLKDGTVLDASTLGNVIFLTIEPGAANEELVQCTAIDSTNKQFTSCTRGLAFSGTSTAAVTANQKTHSSGSTVVMSNVHYVYQQFVDKNGTTQYVTSTVVFNTLPQVSSTTAIPSSDSQLVTKFYSDSRGITGLTAAAVSTTQGLVAYTGLSNCSTTGTCLGVSISTTSSGLTMSSTNYFGKLAVNPSSTSMGIDALGRLYWDQTQNYTLSGALVLSGNVTSTGTFRVQIPTSTLDAATFQTVIQSEATGTAGMSISAGQPIYISSTSTLFVASAATATTAYPYIGFSLGSYTVGQTVRFARIGSIITNQSGLTAGSYYYLQDSAGTIGTSKGTFPMKVGLAISTTGLLLLRPSFNASIAGSSSVTFNGSVVSVTTGWMPTHISLYCSGGSNTMSHGEWWWNSNGGGSQYSIGTNQTSPFGQLSNTQACSWIESGPNTFTLTVATSTNGFTLTPSSVGGSPSKTIYYVAEYKDQ